MAGRSVTTISIAWVAPGAKVLVTFIPKSNWSQKVTELSFDIPWDELPKDRRPATLHVLEALQRVLSAETMQ